MMRSLNDIITMGENIPLPMPVITIDDHVVGTTGVLIGASAPVETKVKSSVSDRYKIKERLVKARDEEMKDSRELQEIIATSQSLDVKAGTKRSNVSRETSASSEGSATKKMAIETPPAKFMVAQSVALIQAAAQPKPVAPPQPTVNTTPPPKASAPAQPSPAPQQMMQSSAQKVTPPPAQATTAPVVSKPAETPPVKAATTGNPGPQPAPK